MESIDEEGNLLVKNLDTGERTSIKDIEKAFDPLYSQLSKNWDRQLTGSETSESEEEEERRLPTKEQSEDYRNLNRVAGYVKVFTRGRPNRELTNLFLIQSIQAHNGPIWCVKLSKTGSYLASAGEDNVIRVWKLSSENSDFELNSKEDIEMTQRIEKNDDIVPKARDITINSLYRKEYIKPRPFREYKGHHRDILSLDWSQNDFLLSASIDKTVKLWHISVDTCLRSFQHADFVTCACFHPQDERVFLSGSLDDKLRLWNAIDKTVLSWTETPDVITACAISEDGKQALVGSYRGQCKVYYLKNEKGDWCIQYITQFDVRSRRGKNSRGSKISGICFSPNGEEFLISSNDSRMRCYRLDDFSRSCKYIGHHNQSSQIYGTFHKNGSFVISGSEDKAVYIWRSLEQGSTTNGGRSKSERLDCEYFMQDSNVTCAIFGPTRNRTHDSTKESGLVIICSYHNGQINIFENIVLDGE
ncbi:WD repeat-containing protein 44 [Galdieria sulphuraria]|nr:WD repeat-containing protein 44 [Galdieria sulphuraria]